MPERSLGGVYVANVTPFKDDVTLAVDEGAYLEHVAWLSEGGVRGVVPFGTNGEGPSGAIQGTLGVRAGRGAVRGGGRGPVGRHGGEAEGPGSAVRPRAAPAGHTFGHAGEPARHAAHDRGPQRSPRRRGPRAAALLLQAGGRGGPQAFLRTGEGGERARRRRLPHPEVRCPRPRRGGRLSPVLGGQGLWGRARLRRGG